jgi:hypothetical protein
MKSLPQLRAAFALALLAFAPAAAADPAPAMEGLERVDSRAALVYVRPGTDWARFRTVQVLPLVIRPEVRDATPRGQSRRGRESFVLRDRDVADLQRIFKDTMRSELERGGFTVLDEPRADTLVVAAELTDIVLNAPIESSRRSAAGRGRTYTQGAGSMAIRAVLADGESRAVVAAAADRTYGQSFWQMNTRTSNVAEAAPRSGAGHVN